MNARDGRATKGSVRGGSVALSDDLLDGLLHALTRLDSPGAETVRDEIAALRLAGGEIRIVPTEAELASVRHVLASLTTASRPRLLRGLESLDLTGATSVAEEISVLHLAGLRVQLRPSDSELRALSTALRALEPISRSGSALTRLRTICEESLAGV